VFRRPPSTADSRTDFFVAEKTPLAMQGAFFVNGYEKVKK